MPAPAFNIADLRPPEMAVPGGWPVRLVVGAGSGLLLVLCFVLLARRFSGGLQQPLSGPAVVAIVFAATLLATCWRSSLRRETMSPTWLMVRATLPTLALIAFCYALLVPGSEPWTVVLTWFVVVGVEGAWWMAAFYQMEPFRSTRPTRQLIPEPLARPAALEFDVESGEDETLPSEVSQRLTRASGPDGSETIYGLLRGEFAPGERILNLHVAFCPPLERNPEMTVGQIEGPQATIKAADVEPYGTRLEVRLSSRPNNRESVLVEFHAQCAGKQRTGN